MPPLPSRPTGLVAFLFTDIEGSTQRWEKHAESMRADLSLHDRLLREAAAAHSGFVFKTMGDAFFVAFSEAADAVLCAASAQRLLAAASWSGPSAIRVRMSAHAGRTDERDDDYFGPTMNRVARILSAGHGGQVLVSQLARDLAEERVRGKVSFRDLGERRLKDLSRPERLFQLEAPGLPSDFPPLKTLDARRQNLPVQATPFIGREALVAEISAVLRSEDVRALTLLGPGGTGKTRLSLQVAADVFEDFPGGALFVPLAPLSDAALVKHAIAEALGVRESPGAELLTSLARELGDGKLLLVLDNFEHVLSAAPFVSELLSRAPALKVLASSRVPLHISFEREHPVGQLALPPSGAPLGEIAAAEAVQLFVQRARAVSPRFALDEKNAQAVRSLCARLDGLPLALELAASRVKHLSVSELQERLARVGPGGGVEALGRGAVDLPDRQRTLSAALQWSVSLLSAELTDVFDRLSVFAGGATMDAVEAVLPESLRSGALELVATLVDHSLLARDEQRARYSMLETVRELSLQRLSARTDAASVHEAHARYFAALAEEVDDPRQLTLSSRSTARLLSEQDNFRAALEWSLRGGRPELALAIASRLGRFFHLAGHWSEGVAWLRRALAAAPETPDVARGLALSRLGTLRSAQGALAEARKLSDQAIAMLRALGADVWLYDALERAGFSAMYQGDLDRSSVLFDQAYELVKRLDDPSRLGRSIARRGWIAFERGDSGCAETLIEESVALYRKERVPRAELAVALNSLGEIYRARGKFVEADLAYRESLTLSREEELAAMTSNAVLNLGVTARALGRLDEAYALCAEGLETLRLHGNERNLPVVIVSLAAIAYDRGRAREAAELSGASRAMLARQGAVMTLADRVDLETLEAKCEAALGAEAVAGARAAGASLSEEDAVTRALEVARA